MKIATFNVNSARMRLPILLSWLQEHAPDLMCLQETKAQDKDFPHYELRKIGYESVFRGQKSYNGVAILSKEPLTDVNFGLDDGGEPDEPRLIRARWRNVVVVNTYVPQGTAPGTPYFQYKLEWYRRVRKMFERHYSPQDLLVWVGDLNVAPEPRDVYDPVALAGGCCFHPDEQREFARVKEWGLVDVFRKHCDAGEQFSFWDYRVPNAVKRKMGWRLDHILATEPLAEKSVKAYIDPAPRLLEKPSDHTPVVAEFKLT